MLAISNVFSL